MTIRTGQGVDCITPNAEFAQRRLSAYQATDALPVRAAPRAKSAPVAEREGLSLAGLAGVGFALGTLAAVIAVFVGVI